VFGSNPLLVFGSMVNSIFGYVLKLHFILKSIKSMFFIFFNSFDVMISKILEKYKKYYFKAFLNEKHFTLQYQTHYDIV
jgi:hypothetical protein